MDIIPYILSEQMVEDLTDEHLQLLTKCTTTRVMPFIEKYLASDKADNEIKSRVQSAYDYILKRDAYLDDEVTKRNSELLMNLNYKSISVAMSVAQLNQIKDAIDYIVKSDYAVPYISSVSSTDLSDLRDSLTIYVKEENHPYAKMFLNNLQKYGDMFRDGRDKQNKGTIVKKIVRNLTMYEILYRSIDFILDLKMQGKTYDSWRFL